MNKRQKKKKFKKQYGINYQQAADILRQWINQATLFIKDFTDKVQTMPEEEFQKFINDEKIMLKQKSLALKIRNMGGKNLE